MSTPPPGGLPAPPQEPATAEAAPRTASDAALARHAARLRRPRIVYAAVVTVVVVVLGVFAAVVWSHGETAHVTLHTATSAPPTLALGVPSGTPVAAWRTGDHAAQVEPQYGGTVVTRSVHTVRGRDARTGRVTWSYTRSDRTVCTALQLDGTTVAIYAVHGNCDEVTALDTGTGKRRWTRTLDEDGMPLNGRPSYAWTDYTFLVYSSSVIYAIDPGSGVDRWTYTRYGCRIGHAVIGSAGTLVNQTCSRAVRCAGLNKCHTGPQLFLRSNASRGDDGKADRDQMKWNIANSAAVPVSAGSVLSAFDPTNGQLTEYRVDTSKPITDVTLTGAPASSAGSVALDTSDAQLVWLGGVTYALSAGSSKPIWATRTVAAPTVLSTSGTAPDLSTARFTVPTRSGAALLDGNTGRVSLSATLPVRGSPVYPLGDGFLVTGPAGVVAYR